MVLKQKLHEAFKGTVEKITGPRTVSAFKEKGVLSVSEFVTSGDNPVSKCPTWSWESGEPSKRKPYLPPEKQYLITRNVPCLRRAASLEEEYEAAGTELLLDNEDNDGWLATHGKPKDRSGEEENLPAIESLEISKNRDVKSVPSHVGAEDEDDIPNMADFEEADNIEFDPVQHFPHLNSVAYFLLPGMINTTRLLECGLLGMMRLVSVTSNFSFEWFYDCQEFMSFAIRGS
ncbi:autophagy-related protein 3-like isoform X1 [Malus sylvestris]|uniref:autophagy-related protein 3-like isoform X1 n=2 Tax=Malus sylvestris TaxID=3752 RepID=UPI0021AD0871|nr:autophagy-related protein 3-like isoform X1 [Malus sylvestris]